MSQPGRPKGRGRNKAIQPSPVEQLARDSGLPDDRILCPVKAKEVNLQSKVADITHWGAKAHALTIWYLAVPFLICQHDLFDDLFGRFGAASLFTCLIGFITKARLSCVWTLRMEHESGGSEELQRDTKAFVQSQHWELVQLKGLAPLARHSWSTLSGGCLDPSHTLFNKHMQTLISELWHHSRMD